MTDERRKRGAWWWLLPLLMVIGLGLLLARCVGGGSAEDGTPAASGSTTSATAPSSPTLRTSASPEATARTDSSPSSTPTASGAGATPEGTVSAGGSTILDATSRAPLAGYVDQAAVGRRVRVQSVPADEGFWVGTDAKNRLWVQLKGTGESPYRVKVGDLVDFDGTLVQHGEAFGTQVGVTAAEGAAQLTSSGAHVEVKPGELTRSS